MNSRPSDPVLTIEQRRKRAIWATLIGNFMEWFDFAVYGFVATSIGRAFFPSDDPTTSFLASMAVFGVAFLFRPLGGAIFGMVGDRLGRKTSLAAAIIVMSVATSLVAVLPTYGQVGMLAPVMLVALRCVQGMSVGGEWTGASAFLVEYAPANRRGLWASVISATAAIGVAVGSAVVYFLSASLSQADFDSWGWRIPFLVAIPMGIVGLYLRLRLTDTPVFEEIKAAAPQAQEANKPSLWSVLRKDAGAIGIAFTFASITGLGFYYFVTYMVNYMTVSVGFERTQAILISGISLVIYGLLCPLAGALSDRIGRRRTYLIGIAGHLVFGIPVFLLVATGNVALALLGLCIFAVSQAIINVMVSVVIVELFPPRTRMTSGSVGYNLGLGPVAGSGPLVAAALVAATGSNLAPAGYLVAIAAIALLVLYRFLPETSRRSLSTGVDAGTRGVGSKSDDELTVQ